MIVILWLLPARAVPKDSVIVSLVTCWPGADVYELCGHEAIRIRGIHNGKPIDTVWNYGTFDFEQPNFIYRFVKGETDYMVSAYPFRWFVPEYAEAGRRVVEQDLNLTQEEAQRLLTLLRYETLPQNRVYRYNYVKDNCATRIIERVDDALGSPVVYPDSVHYGTFRKEMRAYHRDYPWYQFGIDLALGSGIDYQLKGREEMFVPLEMMRKAAHAHLADGRPLVRETRVLNEGVADATLGPTPWFLTPLFVFTLLFLILAGVCWLQWRNRTIYRWIYSVWFGALGLMGCLLTFLVFISSHEATSPNILLLWLNPLQFVIAIGVWFRRKGYAPTVAMTYVNIILVTILMLAWPFQSQSANPAFFPMMGATLLLEVTYAIIISKLSLNNRGGSQLASPSNARTNEEVGNLGAGGGRGSRSRGSGGSRTAKARGGNRR